MPFRRRRRNHSRKRFAVASHCNWMAGFSHLRQHGQASSFKLRNRNNFHFLIYVHYKNISWSTNMVNILSPLRSNTKEQKQNSAQDNQAPILFSASSLKEDGTAAKWSWQKMPDTIKMGTVPIFPRSARLTDVGSKPVLHNRFFEAEWTLE
jgi:hypothetical protein